MDSRLLTKDTALVTGAASGIGRGIAIAIAREGARTLLSDLDAQRGEEIAASLRGEGCDASFIVADLSTREGPSALLNVLEKFGAPSIFVHAASPRRIESDNILEVSDDTWDHMLSVNLRAGFILAREIGRGMMEKKYLAVCCSSLPCMRIRHATSRTTARRRRGKPW